MTNVPVLKEYRMGIEASDAWGTEVAQSIKLMDFESFELTPIRESTQIKDMRGTQAPGHKSVHNRSTGTATASGWLNLEQSPYWFNSLLQDVDPTSTDASGNTWNWVAPGSDGAPAVNSYTIATGVQADSDTVKSITGAIVNTMQITGAKNEPTTVTLGFIGKDVDIDIFDSDAEADVSTSLLTACNTTLYIDTTDSAAGQTEVTTGFDFTLDLNANREVFNYLGSCQPGNYRPARFDGNLRLGLEFDSTSATYLDAVLATSTDGIFERLVRLKFTPQGNDSDYVQIDFVGVALEAPDMNRDLDGIMTIDVNLTGQYNATFGNWLKVEARNAVDAF